MRGAYAVSDLARCGWRSALAVLLACGCSAAMPPAQVEYVAQDSICITVSPTLCSGMRTACGPIDRTAALVSSWCAPGTKAEVK